MKHNSLRLQNYDYSQPGMYFVTICAKDRQSLFTHPMGTNLKADVGADLCVRPNNNNDNNNNHIQLNDVGLFVKHWWYELPNKFPTIKIDEYVIMPNHVHGIIDIAETGTHIGAPLHRVVQWFKTMTSNDYFKYIKQNGLPETGKLWQRNYYEHVIRNEIDLNYTREYIVNNPTQWANDENNPVNIKNNVGADLCVRPPHNKSGFYE